MKILFSNPPGWEPNESGKPGQPMRQWIRAGSRWPFTRAAAHPPNEFRFGGYLPFPFFLAHAAGYTKKIRPDAEVVVRDSVARGEYYPEYSDYIYQSSPDVVVMETASPSWKNDELLVDWFHNQNRRIILCGPIDESKHAQILKDHPSVHAIVQGEYDKQISKAISGPRGVYSHDLLSRDEMAASPFPIWDESCADHYWDACPQGQQAPQLQMWTSRGCPYKCVFCVWPAVMTGHDPDGEHARSVRFYPPDWVEAYIQERLTRCSYQSIYFDDDTFNLSDKHVVGICDVMRKIKLPWSAMCRADTITRDTWQYMKDSGCFGVKIGFESGSQYVIDHIVNKKLNIAKAVETCQWLQNIGINVHTTWTIGLPGETKEQQSETMKTIRHMYNIGACSTHQLSGTSVIEGTPLSTLERTGHLDKYDGAVIDENYKSNPDGQRKIEAMK